jgi:hypothetical protein
MKTLIIASVVVVLLALACGEEEGITRPRIPVINPVYPADVLENVETSFIRRDIDLLKKCLSPDFVFYFDPNDVGQNPPGSIYVIPESWSYTEFWLVARNMFNKTYTVIATSRSKFIIMNKKKSVGASAAGGTSRMSTPTQRRA